MEDHKVRYIVNILSVICIFFIHLLLLLLLMGSGASESATVR